MIFSTDLFIQQINSSSIYQYVWSWTINNDFSLEFGYLIDPLTYILLILITTVQILVLVYSYEFFQYLIAGISYQFQLNTNLYLLGIGWNVLLPINRFFVHTT
ncbi:hypothetical protein OIU77_017634 [Salix suchowensis]|uniref:NADH-Ubiquinone oxidoreductase (complex I) chain 5 N-terminal domain-containing protein n=1 Tax=Salix suchowensis TaxID=1278906 RepID=A0ABQ8ZPG0_9ROSI|nr:hypothetical protein OIU77_017634 [Salix suchowensis]